jgi:hypothetical protein
MTEATITTTIDYTRDFAVENIVYVTCVTCVTGDLHDLLLLYLFDNNLGRFSKIKFEFVETLLDPPTKNSVDKKNEM